MARLTNTERAAIYQAWKDGTSQTKLADQYGVSNNTICKLIKKMNANQDAKPQIEDVENGIPNTPLTSANADEKSEIAEESSANDKIPHVIWVALDDQVYAINWEIEQREQRIAELKEELVQLEDKRYAIEQWLEAHT